MAGEAFGLDAATQARRERLAAEVMEPEALDVLYAWLAFDPADPEREGIVTLEGPNGPLPLVFSRYSTMEQLEPALRQQLRGTGKSARLVAFKRQAVLSTR